MNVREYIESNKVTIKPISFFYIEKLFKIYGLPTEPSLDNLSLYKTVLNTIKLSVPSSFPSISDISEDISPIIYNTKIIKLENKLENLLDSVNKLKNKKFTYINKKELSDKLQYDQDNKILFRLYCHLGYDRQERVNLDKLYKCIQYYIKTINEVLSSDIDEFSNTNLITKDDITYISYVHDQLSTNDKKYVKIHDFMKDAFISIEDLKIKEIQKEKLKKVLISIILPCMPIPSVMINEKYYSMHAFRHDVKDNIEYLVKVTK
ncbi:hypothetical protein [Clostridium massiliodielmoense]|uniref:hypothetical protein n=1 Tax=Clostridium massiliodielmoense TaxID=1776385 RepID=UPI000A2724BD|nr:hypothetical protein [Clostridium massiliodielmoense]